MTGRRGVVGPGYMPKGGRPAAQAHNVAVRARTAAPVVPPHAEAETADERTDGRASDRPTARRTDRLAVVGTAAATAALTAGGVEAVRYALGG